MFSISIVGSSIRFAIPIILASVGCCYLVKLNFVNLSLEGMILISAFSATTGSYLAGNPWLGLIFAILAGVVFSLVFGILTITLKANVLIVGIALNLVAAGLSTVLLEIVFNVRGAIISPRIVSFNKLDNTVLSSIPVIGKIFAEFDPVTWITILSVIVLAVVMYKTPFGLRIRAMGENENAAATAGVDIPLYMFGACIISGIMCGLAGAYLPLNGLSMFTEDMSAGKGFIALAAALLGAGNPVVAAIAGLFFGFATAFALQLQGKGLPSHFVLMTPYVVTIVLLIVRKVKNMLEVRKILRTE